MPEFVAQQFGEANPIFKQEERVMLAKLQKVGSANSQSIGRNGEILLMDLLNRYLPPTLTVRKGHYVTPDRVEPKLSPEVDLMVLDSRYPLLSHNDDGTVYVMLHSVVAFIEVKRRLDKDEIRRIRLNAKQHREDSKQIEEWAGNSFCLPASLAFAYESSISLRTAAQHFFGGDLPDCDLTLMRLPVSSKEPGEREIGSMFHVEHFSEDGSLECFSLDTHAPLSDFYYRLIQDAYYCLDARGDDFNAIGRWIMQYMKWGTVKQGLRSYRRIEPGS